MHSNFGVSSVRAGGGHCKMPKTKTIEEGSDQPRGRNFPCLWILEKKKQPLPWLTFSVGLRFCLEAGGWPG